MRDILLTLIIFGAIPFIFKRPYIGVLVWSWLAYMNPHRLTYGFAYNMKYSMIIAIVTLVAVAMYKGPKKLPPSPVVWLLVAFLTWISISTMFVSSQYMSGALVEYTRMLKIQVVIFLSMMLFQDRRKILLLILVTAFSIGFYGIKGGIFSILTGFHYRIWGPPGSFIEGNNEVGLAMLMILPLFYFLFFEIKNKYAKVGILGCAALIGLAAIATYSRGALVAGICMLTFLWYKSHHKLITGVLAMVFVTVLLANMPDLWFDRMMTIQTYEQDQSAMGRINSWSMAIGMANEHFFGGGYGSFNTANFLRYVNNAEVRDAHSIYFEILGEQGYGGLLLFLSLFIAGWLHARSIIRQSKGIDELQWASNLAKMLQVSLIAYASGGAFLGLAYFDLPYAILALLVVTKTVVDRERETLTAKKPDTGGPLSYQDKLKLLSSQSDNQRLARD